MKKIIIWALAFCLMFGSVLGVSASEHSYQFTNSTSLSTVIRDGNNGTNIIGYLDEVSDTYGKYYALFESAYAGIYYLAVSDVPFSSNGINLFASSSGHVTIFQYTPSDYWFVLKEFDVAPTGTINGYSVSDIIWSTYDIYDESGSKIETGDLNFLTPPLTKMTEEALGEMTMNLSGTMKILVLCGVGLIASLAVLKLFGKRSLIFRS